MTEILSFIFSLAGKGFMLLMLVSVVVLFCRSLWIIATNGGRKWHWYEPDKPWKGGYWTPLLPSAPPYNEYEWNPSTCRFEHRKTREPLHPWEKPVDRCPNNTVKKKKPEWLRFLLEETPATLLEKHRQRKHHPRL